MEFRRSSPLVARGRAASGCGSDSAFNEMQKREKSKPTPSNPTNRRERDDIASSESKKRRERGDPRQLPERPRNGEKL